MKRFFLIILILHIGQIQFLFAQVIISGKITDSVGNAISGVNVNYLLPNTVALLGNVSSNSQGHFQFQANVIADSIQLNFNRLSFAKKSMVIANKSNNQLFVQLKESATQLKGIIVKNPSIYKSNDTLNYQVKSFTSKEDRVIADVIRKLPGVEMQGSQILFQGKAIQKYTIDGLNMLDGGYALANENLPANAVKTVQLIENDQPIKILAPLVFSDKTTLNIKLKKVSLTGTGKIGVGAKPLLRDFNLTPMFFHKAFQSLFSYQTNNVGQDVALQLQSFTIGSTFDNDISDLFDAKPKIFLQLQNITTPPFSKNRWLQNNVNLVSGNFIKKLKKEWLVKAKLSYVRDFRKLAAGSLTQIFTQNKVVNIKENSNNNLAINDLRGNVTLEKNEKNIYLRNVLSFKRNWSENIGDVLRNDSTNIHQLNQLNHNYISNKLTVARNIGKQLVNFNSNVTYEESPQLLSVSPGQFNIIFNQGKLYEQIEQSLTYTNFSANHSFGFAKKIWQITFMPKIGINIERNVLKSAVAIEQNGIHQEQSNPQFINDMIFTENRPFIEIAAFYEKRNWRINGTLPWEWKRYQLENKTMAATNLNQSFSVLNPNIAVNYKINSYWEASLKSRFKNNFGDISRLYTAYVLNTYTNIQRYNAQIPIGRSLSNQFSLNYKDVMNAFFAYLTFSYNNGVNDFMNQTGVDNQGFITTNLIQQKNNNSKKGINATVNYFFDKLKTNLKLGGDINLGTSQQMFNGVLNRVNTLQNSCKFQLVNELTEVVYIAYNANINLFQNKIDNREINNVNTQQHQLELSLYPFKNTAIVIANEYYYNSIQKNKHQFFSDLTCRYTFTKKRIDIEFSLNNLFNNKTFASVYSKDYTLIQNNFVLRPRQVVIYTKFNF